MLVQLPVSQSQPMPIPHLNTSEAAFVSPIDMTWDNRRSYSTDEMDAVTWNYYTLPPSPPASVSSYAEDSPQLDHKMVGPRFTSESQSESDQQPCVPTNQLFDLETMDAPSSSSSVSPPPSMARQLTISSDTGPPLNKSFPTIGVKKGRGTGDRITTKDFVPPDVTGLSKREARLLKNRAAAFLSRQRKREEFEAMEIRVKELEEENSRLLALVEKGNKYDDLLSKFEQLRLCLSIAEKRERELTVEIAHRTEANQAVKTESHDINLPPTSYVSYGPPSKMTIIRELLLSSLPSLLALQPQTSLPITLSIPLSSGSARPSATSFNHQSTPCDIKDHGRSRFGHESIGFHPSSADVESSGKMGIDGELPDIDGHHSLGSFAISLDTSIGEDGRGSVRVHVSERISKVHAGRQRASSLASWSGSDGSFGATCYASPPLSAPTSIPSPGGMDHLGVFASNTHPRMGFDTQLMSSGYAPFGQHDSEQAFDYYPGLIFE